MEYLTMDVRCMELRTQNICPGVRPRLMMMENTPKATGETVAQNALLIKPASAFSPSNFMEKFTINVQWRAHPMVCHGVQLKLMLTDVPHLTGLSAAMSVHLNKVSTYIYMQHDLTGFTASVSAEMLLF